MTDSSLIYIQSHSVFFRTGVDRIIYLCRLIASLSLPRREGGCAFNGTSVHFYVKVIMYPRQPAKLDFILLHVDV